MKIMNMKLIQEHHAGFKLKSGHAKKRISSLIFLKWGEKPWGRKKMSG